MCVAAEFWGVFPAATPALAANTPYFVHVEDANTLTLYTVLADALAGSGASMEDLTANGTGTTTLDAVTIVVTDNADVIQVSSSGSLSTGIDDVIFRTAFGNANYLVTGTVKGNSDSSTGWLFVHKDDGGSAAKVRVATNLGNNSYKDFPAVSLVIYPNA